MKLLAKDIGGQACGVDLLNWCTIDLVGCPAFDVSDLVNEGYIDITSIQNLASFGFYNTTRDYKYIRDIIRDLVIQDGNNNIISTLNTPPVSPAQDDAYKIGQIPTGIWVGKEDQIVLWDNAQWVYFEGDSYADPIEEFGFTFQSSEDQEICATNLIGTVNQQINAFATFLDKEVAQKNYRDNVQKCRLDRYNYFENNIMQYLPNDAITCIQEIGNMGYMYYEHGIDGKQFGDTIDGLLDWVTGVGAYVGIGLTDKGWTTEDSRNMTQYSSDLADILYYEGITT